MPDSLEISDIETLSDLRSALARFAGDTQQALRAAEREIRQTLEWLDERIRHWQREVERAARAVQQAEAALSRCEASGYFDEDGHYVQPPCIAERAALRRAEEHLRECQENLQTAQVWRSQVAQSAEAYYREARRLEQVAGSHTEKAQAELASLRQRYEAVRQAQVAAGIAGAIAGGVVALGAALASRLSIAGADDVGIEDLQPNTTYRKGAYEFQTDKHGRTKSVSATLELKAGSRSQIQGQAGRLGRITDEGGHLIGTRFNGPTDAFNLVPQDANLNRGAWKTMENGWARALESGHEVRVLIDPLYRSQSVRPYAFQVVSQIDMGGLEYRFFRNKPT